MGANRDAAAPGVAKYRVVVVGVNEGYAAQSVAADVARLLRTEPRAVAGLLSGRATVFARGLDLTMAARQAALFKKCGCRCVVEPDNSEPHHAPVAKARRARRPVLAAGIVTILVAAATAVYFGQLRYRSAPAAAVATQTAGSEEAATVAAVIDPALERLQRAADAGDPDAQLELALTHLEGRGVPIDRSAALRWFRAAAARGVVAAETRLGELLASSENEGDRTEALQWLRRAAERGDGRAQVGLARATLTGGGDSKEAAAWLRKAANAGISEAQINLQLGAADGKPWVASADAVKDARAQVKVADALMRGGEGARPNPSLAVKWYREAAAQGDAEAQFKLARAFATGRGTPHNDTEAVHWLRLAAAQGYGPAQLALGDAIANGRGAVRSDAEALDWYRRAAAQGIEDAARRHAELMLRAAR